MEIISVKKRNYSVILRYSRCKFVKLRRRKKNRRPEVLCVVEGKCSSYSLANCILFGRRENLLPGQGKEGKIKIKEERVWCTSLMSFGGFLENSTGGGGARIVADIPYNNTNDNNNNMPTSAIAQPRLVTQSLTKSMFNSPGLSLALVRLEHLFFSILFTRPHTCTCI